MARKSYKTWGIENKVVPLTPELASSEEGRKFIHRALNPPKIAEMLGEIENQSQKILRDNKLDEDWTAHIGKNPSDFPDELSFHAFTVLKHLSRVRHWISEGNASIAATECIHMMQGVMAAMITFFEPDIYRGKHTLESASSGGPAKKSAYEGKKRQWQKEADLIWQQHPTHSVLQVSKMVEEIMRKRTDDMAEASFETIRRAIKHSANNVK